MRKLDGLDVKSSVRVRRIDITPADVKKGVPLDPTACAAAQCIIRSMGASAKVHRGMTYIMEGKSWRKYKTSSALRMETIIFDRGGQFIPGEYDLLPVPEPVATAKPKTSASKGKTPRQMRRATKRYNIPGVRASARHGREHEEETEKE